MSFVHHPNHPLPKLVMPQGVRIVRSNIHKVWLSQLPLHLSTAEDNCCIHAGIDVLKDEHT